MLIRVLCERLRPERMIDLGSGFSSFVLRDYSSRIVPRPEVWSVEGDQRWLEETASFLRAHGLPDDQLLTWADFTESSPGRFDFVLADSFRDVDEPGGDNYPRFLELLAQNGVLVLDDFQKRSYRVNAYRALRGTGHTLYVLSEYARDSFGRYPAMVVGTEEQVRPGNVTG